MSSLQKACEGILPEYQKNTLQNNLNAYGNFATISTDSVYKIGLINGLTNFFCKECKGEGTIRIYKTKCNAYACDGCTNINKKIDKKCAPVCVETKTGVSIEPDDGEDRDG